MFGEWPGREYCNASLRGGHCVFVGDLFWLQYAVVVLRERTLRMETLKSVIVPSRRSTAFSYFMLISHLFGDATGPYIIGAVSDAIRGPVKTPETQYLSLIKACAVTVVLLCVSAALYFVCAAVLIKDQYKFKEQMGLLNGSLKRPASSNSSNDRLNDLPHEDDIETAEQRL
ncbi:hypothetical protein TELCIR_07442 [Teladorsagia circumcincta]|uniref:Major facilitator superfamily (MFS) profile domain-containing protein n=1 Tax=Teladorsagia circumcincta TaxID=45464 RepID=A0A2G9ULT1_TELCI|nr:hypothetical protein TELCIR_07442 [Teladorsagia circumcincta]